MQKIFICQQNETGRGRRIATPSPQQASPPAVKTILIKLFMTLQLNEV